MSKMEGAAIVIGKKNRNLAKFHFGMENVITIYVYLSMVS